MQSKVLHYLLLVILSFTYSSCDQAIAVEELHGSWEIVNGKKNNVSTLFLDGTWLIINDKGCKSNLFANKFSLQSYTVNDSLIKVDTGDHFRIKGMTDTTLILEIIKSRNLFTLEMKKVENL